MKIYEIGTGYTPIPAQMGAATEIVVEELVKAFRKLGTDVELLDIQTGSRKENSLPITEIPVPSFFGGTDVKLGIMHKLKRVVYSVCLAAQLRKILKNTEEQVVLHFHNQYNMFFFLKLVSPKLRKKAKTAYTVHSYIWPGEWEEIKDTVNKRYFQEIYCVKNADYVLVLNDKTAEHFIKQLSVAPQKIYRVGNGVNTDIYSPLTQAQMQQSMDKAGLAGKKVIFQVGSVCDRKNQLGAVRMLADYLCSNTDVVYMYAGGIIDTEYKAQIDAFAQEKGIAPQVIYAGELAPGQQLNICYNMASLTVFPSKIESFGLVIIESVSAGTPVLLKNRPLFSLDNGCMTYASEENFVNKVHSLINSRKDGTQARKEVQMNYSWEKIAADHLDIWKQGER